MTYKTLNGCKDLPVDEFLLQHSASCTRSNGLKLQKPHIQRNASIVL